VLSVNQPSRAACTGLLVIVYLHRMDSRRAAK
jgi:hypothetical protein